MINVDYLVALIVTSLVLGISSLITGLITDNEKFIDFGLILWLLSLMAFITVVLVGKT